MLGSYRIAALGVIAVTVLTFMASYWGWGLSSDASVQARGVRQGSLRGRSHFGGGPHFGK